jgi:hypothetical protein
MALNSSGPISLGGTVVGQSIAVENGGTGTSQISLNDTAVRGLAGVPTGTIVMPLNFWGKSNQPYWIANMAIISTDIAGSCKNASGNIYIAMSNTTGGPASGQVIKLNNLGSVQWSTNIVNTTPTSRDMPLFGITLFSSGNIGIAGYYRTGNTLYHQFLGELNTSAGTVISSNTRRQGTAASTRTNCLISASNGSVLTGGNTSGGSNTYTSIQNFSSVSGARTWGQRASSSGGLIYGIAQASNGNVIGVGSYTGTPAKSQIFSLTSAGAPVFQIASNTTVAHVYGCVVCVGTDSYQAGYATNGTVIQAYISKYGVSGNFVWGRTLYQSPNRAGIPRMDKDSLGNLYIAWPLTNGTKYYATLIAKYNTSGVLQWQREFNRSGSSLGISVINDNTFVLSCNGNTANGLYLDGMWFCQLPTDGSKTGTYTVAGYSVTYSASSWTETSYSVATTTITNTAAGADIQASGPYTQSSYGVSTTVSNI